MNIVTSAHVLHSKYMTHVSISFSESGSALARTCFKAIATNRKQIGVQIRHRRTSAQTNTKQEPTPMLPHRFPIISFRQTGHIIIFLTAIEHNHYSITPRKVYCCRSPETVEMFIFCETPAFMLSVFFLRCCAHTIYKINWHAKYR